MAVVIALLVLHMLYDATPYVFQYTIIAMSVC